MDLVKLKNDSQCKWLKNTVLKKVLPAMLKSVKNPEQKTMYIIKDWISNDNGKVGVDLTWLKQLGVSVVDTYRDLPDNEEYIVVNTGYDSIVHEEIELKKRNIEIWDQACPFVRKLRVIFEEKKEGFQYVLLCEKNHIIIKNFKSIFPEDMILVQMNNYKEQIEKCWNGKPIIFVPYVTFLEKHIETIQNFIESKGVSCTVMKATCMWASGPISPITEIYQMKNEELEGIHDALITTTKGSTNKSLASLMEALTDRNLNIIQVSSLSDYLRYSANHKKDRVLLVRSPIPNKAEKEIELFLKYGFLKAYFLIIADFIQKKIRMFKIK